MKCFGSGKPNLTNSDYAYNIKSEVNYHHMANLAHNQQCQTHNGNVKIDCSGYLVHTDSYASLLSLTYGQALCAPCDLSSAFINTPPGQVKCPCNLRLTKAVVGGIIAWLVLFPTDIKAEFLAWFLEYYFIDGLDITVPWNMLSSPDGWNANYTTFDGSGVDIITLWDASGCSDINKNTLNNPATYDGSGICILNTFNLFSTPCETKYYPEGTYSFKLREFIGVLLYNDNVRSALSGMLIPGPYDSVLDFFMATIGPLRPARTVTNYLQRVNGFHYPASIRFFILNDSTE